MALAHPFLMANWNRAERVAFIRLTLAAARLRPVAVTFGRMVRESMPSPRSAKPSP